MLHIGENRSINQTQPAHLPNVSVSAIELFRRCNRAYWLRYVARLKPPDRPALAVGTVLHAVSEAYVQNQPLYPDGWDKRLTQVQATWVRRVAQYAIEQGIWLRTPTIRIEEPIALIMVDDETTQPIPYPARLAPEEPGKARRVLHPTAEDLATIGKAQPLAYLAGFIDVYDPGDGRTMTKIADHKSSKNRRYGKKKADIQKELQLNIYAAWDFTQHPLRDALEASYNVYLKEEQDQTKEVYVVRDIIHRAAVANAWAAVVRDTRTIAELRRTHVPETDAKDPAGAWREIPGVINTHAHDHAKIRGSCDAYGGCPYKPLCFGQCSSTQLKARLTSGLAQPPQTTTKPTQPTVPAHWRR